MTIFSPSASASPNRRPIAAALCSSAEVDLTGVSRSVNQPHSACTLSPIHWNTGLSGSNAALMGPAAALNPSTTPPRNAVMGCQYFQTTSATPASAVTTRPIGLSRAPNRPDTAYRATRSIASEPDASTRSTVPAAVSPPRSIARGFINITATARKPDNPDRKSATGAPATVFRTFPVSDAVRRKDDNGAVSKPAALPDEASPRRSSASGAPANQDNALLVRVTAAVTEGNVLIPSTENPRRMTASGPSTAASATAKVPRPTVTAATTAATFISVPVSSGLASTQRRNAPVTLFTVYRISISGWRSVSPRLLKVFCAPVLTSNH